MLFFLMKILFFVIYALLAGTSENAETFCFIRRNVFS